MGIEGTRAKAEELPAEMRDSLGLHQERSVELVLLLWRRRRLLLRGTALGLVVSTLIAFSIPKRYESTVRLMPPDAQSLSGAAMMSALAGSSLSGSGAGLASSLLNIKTPGATFLGILDSRTAKDDLINRFDLLRVYRRNRYLDARRVLTDRTSIDEDKKSGIITITVTDKDPYRAREMAAGYVQELDKLVSQLSTSSARRERMFLDERLKTVKHELDDATTALSGFSSRNATLDVQAQGKAMIDAAARLQGELIAARSELSGLESVYTENNVRVRSVRARIDELQRQLQKIGGSSEDVDGADLKADQLYPSIRKLPLLGVTYYDLYRRAKIQETIYETLTKQYELAKVQEAKDIPSVKVLDVADLPEKKSFPPRLLIMALGMFLSAFTSITWVLGRRVWDCTDDSYPAKAFAVAVWSEMRHS